VRRPESHLRTPGKYVLCNYVGGSGGGTGTSTRTSTSTERRVGRAGAATTFGGARLLAGEPLTFR
jgi:hypothetical protein